MQSRLEKEILSTATTQTLTLNAKILESESIREDLHVESDAFLDTVNTLFILDLVSLRDDAATNATQETLELCLSRPCGYGSLNITPSCLSLHASLKGWPQRRYPPFFLPQVALRSRCQRYSQQIMFSKSILESSLRSCSHHSITFIAENLSRRVTASEPWPELRALQSLPISRHIHRANVHILWTAVPHAANMDDICSGKGYRSKPHGQEDCGYSSGQCQTAYATQPEPNVEPIESISIEKKPRGSAEPVSRMAKARIGCSVESVSLSILDSMSQVLRNHLSCSACRGCHCCQKTRRTIADDGTEAVKPSWAR